MFPNDPPSEESVRQGHFNKEYKRDYQGDSCALKRFEQRLVAPWRRMMDRFPKDLRARPVSLWHPALDPKPVLFSSACKAYIDEMINGHRPEGNWLRHFPNAWQNALARLQMTDERWFPENDKAEVIAEVQRIGKRQTANYPAQWQKIISKLQDVVWSKRPEAPNALTTEDIQTILAQGIEREKTLSQNTPQADRGFGTDLHGWRLRSVDKTSV